jgi:hypothetical protein
VRLARFNHMNRYLLAVALVAGCGSSPRPVELARSYIAQTSPGRDAGCFSYVSESDTADGVVIAVREHHDDACGGDPGVAPVIARLRVHASGSLDRYDVVADAWDRVR